MDSLIFISPFVNKFLAFFQYIFVSERKATQYNLLLLVLGIAVTSCLSVRKCFRHVASRLSDKSLNSFYYLMSSGKISLNIWSTQIIKLALRCIPPAYEEAPILLAVDDTLVEKERKKFAHRGKLFEHFGYSQPKGKSGASQNKKGCFIYGHCFVTLIMLIPAMTITGLKYVPVVVAQRMWIGKVSKLVMAREMVLLARNIVGEHKQLILLCDSWYPKGEVARLVRIQHLDIICNARSDSAMFEMPVPKEKPGPGRPPKYGKQIKVDDFELVPVPQTDYHVGVRTVQARIFGDKPITAIVTRQGEQESRRVFFCTNLEACNFFQQHPQIFSKRDAQAYISTNADFVPLAIYSLRWEIETSYLELKSFWAFREYKVRSKDGIERLLNLQSMVYSVFSLLPILDSGFAPLEQLSIQERRWHMEQLISQEIIFHRLEERLQTDKNKLTILQQCREIALQESFAA